MGRCESSCKDLPLIKSFHILYMPDKTDEIQQMINAYDEVVKGIDSQALDPTSARAYGGIIPAGEEALTERIFHQLVILAWTRLGKICSHSKLKDKLSEYLLKKLC
jgi:hypothetical protein